jgi:hypothetical protein
MIVVLRDGGNRKFALRVRRLVVGAALVGAGALCQPAVAAGGGANDLSTNEHMLEELSRAPDFDITDVETVFDFVLGSLPDEVKVYPTENYYYFSFRHGGLDYAGNIRLAARDRDDGVVHFAYFPAATVSGQSGDMSYRPFTPADGVGLEKLDALVYRVTFRDRAVTFRLNDLSDVVPPQELLSASDDYLGPVYDESGLQFYLLYNRDLKIFHYILNEQATVPELLRPTAFSERILIGHRSGFAFYQDQRIDRKILIGVHYANASVNNYYDGPFDQLPDNFLKGDTLKTALETSNPAVVGNIDRFGYFTSGEGRFLIGPYLQYTNETDLVAFDLCATNADLPPDQYYGCFAIQGGGL